MTTLMPVEHIAAAVLRADIADVEREIDRIDALGDAAAVVRLRLLLGPRIRQLGRALAAAEKKPALSHTQGVNE